MQGKYQDVMGRLGRMDNQRGFGSADSIIEYITTKLTEIKEIFLKSVPASGSPASAGGFAPGFFIADEIGSNLTLVVKGGQFLSNRRQFSTRVDG